MSGSNALVTVPRDPTVLVNPLAAMNAGIEGAGQVYELRQKQANEAAGQAYQGAINQQTGEFDPNEFRRRLAASGPAAMAAGAALLNTQQMSSDQLKQSLEKQKWINSTAGALLQAGDFSDAAMLGALHNGVAGHILTLPEAQAQLQTMPADAEGRRRWLQVHQDTSGSYAEQMQRRFGTRENIQTPQATYNVQIPHPSANAPTIVTPHGPTPGNTTTITVPVDEQGIIPMNANGVPSRTPKTWQPMTVPVTAVPGVPQGGPPQPIPAPGSPAVAAPPGGLPPGAPPPPPGTQLHGGRFGQPSAAPAPNAAVPPPAAAPPAVVGAPATAKPPAFTSAPQGQQTELDADQKQFIADRTALPQRQTQEQNLQHAYEALRLVTSGRGTETASNIRNLLATVGLLPPGKVDDEALYEIARKYTERTIADAGNAGGTDTARALAGQSNPNVSLINPANLAFLRNDIGKVRQQMAPYMTAPDTTIGRGFGKHSADTASNTDYRGFNWDMYSQKEQQEILKSVGPEGTKAHDALVRAIGMGKTFWPTKGPVSAVPHAEASPSAPPPYMLATAQPQSNPLLAA